MEKKRYRARKSINYEINNFLNIYETFKEKTKNKFCYLNKNFNGFNDITDEKRNELIKEAEILKEKYMKQNDLLCPNYYKVLNQINEDIILKKKYKPNEAIIVLIETIDSKLKLIKIFMSSKTDFEIETKSTKMFGFYDSNLIDYEIEYAKKFKKAKPDSKILSLRIENM